VQAARGVAMPNINRSIVVNAPITKVFDISNQMDRWPEMMPEYRDAEILEAKEGRKIWFRLAHESGAEWISWRVLYPPYVAYAERQEPKLPFKYMQIVWTYTPVGPEQTEMTWDMTFELPDEQKAEEGTWTKNMTAHTEINQTKMKTFIEAQ
jgi:aromatase